ncbi:MAG: NAD(P)-binding domain-containing protein [Chloroflexaceae bacterium]|jgi:UDPglucose 6-dehydrogenase|nr:NAD(P)-binding domain-containing protein [Chloroflexaceae bacterium]
MARIVIIGSGVVGQATGKGFTKKGHGVSYVDINPQTINRLRAEGLDAMMAAEVEWDEVEVVMLAVSTPSVDGDIVLDYIKSAAADVGRGLAQTDNYITVVVRSTVPPTTTERVLTPILEQTSGKRVGEGFGMAMNPEFLRAVSNEQDFARPWITVLGVNDGYTAEILDELYKPFGALIVHCTPTEAEMIKYVNNVYNAVKISYFNEVHAICQHFGLDSNLIGAAVARSAESMWNPLYGTRGGVPYGGACLPKDTVAFLSFVRQHGLQHLMLEATHEVNSRLEAWVPAATSPDKIEEMLVATRQRDTGDEELLERVAGAQYVVTL